MTGSDEYADLAGGYVLGALSTEERIAFEAHLETCASCAHDVMEFSAIPGLLALIDEADLEPPSAAPLWGAAAVVAGDGHRRRASARRWQVGALLAGAAATVLAAVLVFGGADGSSSSEAGAGAAAFAIEHEMVVESDYDITGSIGLSQRPWGTFILIDLFDVPERDDYTMWTVGTDGTWTSVANWVWSETGTCRIPAASGLPVDQIERVVITGATDKADGLAWGR